MITNWSSITADCTRWSGFLEKTLKASILAILVLKINPNMFHMQLTNTTWCLNKWVWLKRGNKSCSASFTDRIIFKRVIGPYAQNILSNCIFSISMISFQFFLCFEIFYSLWLCSSQRGQKNKTHFHLDSNDSLQHVVTDRSCRLAGYSSISILVNTCVAVANDAQCLFVCGFCFVAQSATFKGILRM